MDFEISEEQQLLRDGLRELLEGASPIRRIRDIAYEGDGRDGALWSQLVDTGWPGLTSPAASGGADLGYEELTIAAVECGRAVLHLPLVTTLLAARALARGVDSAALQRVAEDIASGRQSCTLALLGTADDRNRDASGVDATEGGGGWVLNGELRFVPFGPLADLMLLEASHTGGSLLLALPTSSPGLRFTELGVMDRSVRQYVARFDSVEVSSDLSLNGSVDASPAICVLLDEWRIALAAESLGACERMLELTVDYAKDRVAFGRPIGSNQAVKTRVAEMAVQVERMRSATYYGAINVSGDESDRVLGAAIAKATAAEGASFVATQAIHVHGGIGYTWEHDMHIYFKRVKSNELLLGDGSASRRRLAAVVL